MNFQSRLFLLSHVQHTLDFYDKSVDPKGSFYPAYKDDGTIYNPETGGYAWTMNDGKITDDTNQCYGFGFVLLAYGCALRAGIEEARQWIREIYAILWKNISG